MAAAWWAAALQLLVLCRVSLCLVVRRPSWLEHGDYEHRRLDELMAPADFTLRAMRAFFESAHPYLPFSADPAYNATFTSFGALRSISLHAKAMSQEDTISLEMAAGQERLLVLELGAHEGRKHSCTWLQERLASWRPLHVEADPRLFRLLHAQRPHSANVQAAVCSETRRVHFRSDPANGAWGAVGILELMDPKYLLKYHRDALDAAGRLLPEAKLARDPYVQAVQCVPLQAVLEQLGTPHVHFFVLDVEGAELAVLRTVDFQRTSFDVIAVEVDTELRAADFADTVDAFLRPRGYLPLFTHLNMRWYASSRLVDAAVVARPNPATAYCFNGDPEIEATCCGDPLGQPDCFQPPFDVNACCTMSPVLFSRVKKPPESQKPKDEL